MADQAWTDFPVLNALLDTDQLFLGSETDREGRATLQTAREYFSDKVKFVESTILPSAADVTAADRRKIHILLDNGVIHSIAHLRRVDPRIAKWTIGHRGGTNGFWRGNFGRLDPALNIERLYNVLDTSQTGSATWLYVDAGGTIPRQQNLALYYKETGVAGNWRRVGFTGGADGSYSSSDFPIATVPRPQQNRTYDVAIRDVTLISTFVGELPDADDYIQFNPDGVEWVTLLDADAIDQNRVHLDTIFDIAGRDTRHFPLSLSWDADALQLDVALPHGSEVNEGDLIVLGPIPSGMDSTDESGFTMSVDGGTAYDVTGQDQLPIVANTFHAGRYYQALVLDLEYVILDTYNLDVPGTSGLTQDQVDARVTEGVADWAEEGNTDQIPADKYQTSLNDSGLIQNIADDAVANGVADWAEEGNTDQIPADKLGNAPAGESGGLTQDQVDARVQAGVSDWAEEGNTDAIPTGKLPGSATDGLSQEEVEEQISNDVHDWAQFGNTDQIPVTKLPEAATEGLNQGEVDARVQAGVEDWAEAGNTDAIPASKLSNAPTSDGGGLTQDQVDARVQEGVSDWAEEGNTDAIPASKLTNAPAGSGGGSAASEEILLEDTVDTSRPSNQWNNISVPRALTEDDDTSDIILLAKAVGQDWWDPHYIPAREFRLLGLMGASATALTVPHFQIKATRGAAQVDQGWGIFPHSTLRIGKSSDTTWRIGSPHMADWQRIKIKLVSRGGGSSNGAQQSEGEGSSDSSITTIGGIHQRWRLQQYSATEPAASSIPEPVDGSFDDLGDWIREDENPMTLGQDTSLQQWIGLGAGSSKMMEHSQASPNKL